MAAGKSYTLMIDGDMVRLAKDEDGEWSVVLWRLATSAELTTYSAKQVSSTHHTGLRQ